MNVDNLYILKYISYLYHDSILFDGYKEQEQPNAELECFLFTPFNGNLTTSNNMPIMRSIFLKYNTINTTLPLNTSVERMFSLAQQEICALKSDIILVTVTLKMHYCLK